jgi:hypothetical protein
MRRSTPFKLALAPKPLRKATTVTSIIAPSVVRGVPRLTENRVRPATSAATLVTSRVRDGLVLRVVGLKKSAHVRNLAHGSGAR